MSQARPPGLLPAFLALVLLGVPSAAAHADLVEADPPVNTRVDEAPAELRLLFSERLSSTYTNVKVVLDGDDRVERVEVDEGDARRLTVFLEPLPDGVHSVQWRTLSSADGHTRSGAYFLAVNADPSSAPSPAAAPAATNEGGPGEAVARGMAFMGHSLAAGLILALLLFRPHPALRARLQGLLVAGAAAGALGVAGTAASLAARIDTGVMAALQTEPGQVLALRAALGVGAAVAYGLAMRSRAPWPLALGGVLSFATLVATSLGSHAASAGATLLVNDWIHLVAVAFWVSGVVTLVAAALLRDGQLGAMIARFSPLAVLAVALIVVTGTLASVDRLTRVSDLWSTAYGTALLVKILLLAPLVALGAYHRYWLLPRVHDEDGPRLLRRSAGAEVALMAIVLLAAGALTGTSPPEPDGGSGGGPRPYYAFSDSGLDVQVFITPTPVRAGFQEIFVDVDAGPEVNRSQLSAFLSLHEPGGSEASPRPAHVLFNGTYHWSGALLTVPGNWSATLVIQGGQENYVYMQHEFPIAVRPA